ncbi:PP2C family protein-serine/threonine phosphatase [Streptomyces sp. NPDC088789]|uniref:PP2C family protein-serine/threonine phosphatase n=1 Tax=Streptomyces sp. NPDC088789 TaxID=3365899 RepID=UPI003821C7A2
MSNDGAGRSTLDRLPWTGRSGLWHQYRTLRVRGRTVTWVPPLVLLIAIVTVDYWTGTEFRIIAWVVLVPGIAAALCEVWMTAAFTGLVLATYLFVEALWPERFSPRLSDFTLIAIGGVLATLACAVRVRGEEHVLRMRDITETVRRTVLRPLPPGWGGLEHAEVYLTADTEARVGGDFYDIQPGLYGTRVLLGDVQGKGLGAVEAAAALLGTFREAGYHEPALGTVGQRLEIRMMRHRRRVRELGREDGDRFATAVLLEFPDHDPAAIHVVNFGHEPPLVVGPGGVRALPEGEALPLGLGDLEPRARTGGGRGRGRGPGSGAGGQASGSGSGLGLGLGRLYGLWRGWGRREVGLEGGGARRKAVPGPWIAVHGPGVPGPDERDARRRLGPPVVRRVALGAGETLLLTTDGVTEARDADGEFFPLADTVARAVAGDARSVEPERLVGLVRESVLRHCGGRLADDTTVFAIRRL